MIALREIPKADAVTQFLANCGLQGRARLFSFASSSEPGFVERARKKNG
jgi:hypothetical protein